MTQWQNLKVKVAVGSVAPPEPDATFHCLPIPQGYVVVMVDEITEGFEELQLDHRIREGETQLGIALKTPCLWWKEHIKLLNFTPPPPPPASQLGTPPPPASDQGNPPPAPAREGGNTPPPSPPAPVHPRSPPPPSPRRRWRNTDAAAPAAPARRTTPPPSTTRQQQRKRAVSAPASSSTTRDGRQYRFCHLSSL